MHKGIYMITCHTHSVNNLLKFSRHLIIKVKMDRVVVNNHIFIYLFFVCFNCVLKTTLNDIYTMVHVHDGVFFTTKTKTQVLQSTLILIY